MIKYMTIPQTTNYVFQFCNGFYFISSSFLSFLKLMFHFLQLNHYSLFCIIIMHPQFSSVQSLSLVQVFETPWTAAHQASLSITNSQRWLKLVSIELVMPSNHLIFCCSLHLLPSIFPSIRVFSNESLFRIR